MIEKLRKHKKKIKITAAVIFGIAIAIELIIMPKYRAVMWAREIPNVFEEDGQVEWNGVVYNRLMSAEFDDVISKFILSVTGSSSIFDYSDLQRGDKIGTIDGNRKWKVYEVKGHSPDELMIAFDGKLPFGWLYMADKGLPTMADVEKVEVGKTTLTEVYFLMGRDNDGIIMGYNGPQGRCWTLESGENVAFFYDSNEIIVYIEINRYRWAGDVRN